MRIWIALMVLSAGLAAGGDIYGTLRQGPSPRPGITFQVLDTAGRSVTSGKSEADGSFRFKLSANGRFTFRVSYGGQTPSADIYSSPRAVQYDFELVQRDKTWVLMRR